MVNLPLPSFSLVVTEGSLFGAPYRIAVSGIPVSQCEKRLHPRSDGGETTPYPTPDERCLLRRRHSNRRVKAMIERVKRPAKTTTTGTSQGWDDDGRDGLVGS